MASGAIFCANSQARCNESARQLAARDAKSACLDQRVDAVFRHVVVVEIEGAAWNSRAFCEGMELVQALVTDEVCPEEAVRGPQGSVDEYRHVCQHILDELTRRAALID